MTDNQKPQPGDTTSFRKLTHVEICLREQVEARCSACWEDFHPVHRAMPNLNWEDLDTRSELFGKELTYPLICAAMTGGHPDVRLINETIARVANELGFGVGIGSERAAIEKNIPYITESFKIVRDLAPDALIIGNLGAAQFSKRGGFGVQQARAAIDLVAADAIAIHVNPAQELVQTEGDSFFRGFFHQIQEVARRIPVPIIVKEVGSGFAKEDAASVEDSPLAGVDVGGCGGTSWIGVEALRAARNADELHANLGQLFWDWGIPTAISIVEVRSNMTKTLIATGGVRNGLQAAKALALGADAVGMALPFLKAAHQGHHQLRKFVNGFVRELKTAMFLTGCRTIDDLRRIPLVVGGHSRIWLQQRGINIMMPWRRSK